ncbi:MAG: endopeptidase La, partial [Candidatus Saganbacteria bacterium]|nr:endopeptidase La [Candidatus Saganbacteria bacterium]
KTHGLEKANIVFEKETIGKIVREYAKEAGVRNLKRIVDKVLRKIAIKVVKGKETEKKQTIITINDLEEYLGAPIYHYGTAEEKDQVGVACGMAWTEVGGDTLPVEVTIMKGRGTLTITGQLGDVMQESAKAAMSYVRSRTLQLELDENFYRKYDFHIHVPEGAVPKDGPSAGITIATALVSALTLRPIRKDVSMTGEITLRGKVLPIGGLKEKMLAAHRAGIREIIFPDENLKDYKEFKESIPKEIKIHPVKDMDQVLKVALRPLPEAINKEITPTPENKDFPDNRMYA